MRAQTAESYQQQWRRYQWLRNGFIVALVIWATPVIPLGFDARDVAIFFGWSVPVTLLAVGLLKWKCPRCGNVFSGGRKHWILLPPKCVSCGLPKFSTDPNAASGADENASGSPPPIAGDGRT